MMTKEEIVSKVSPLFKASWRDVGIDVRDHPEGTILMMTAEYEAPVLAAGLDPDVSYGGHIRRALDAKKVREYAQVDSPGCESCDWGSEYGWEFLIEWNE